MKLQILLFAAFLSINSLSARPISQFRGFGRDGHYPEKGLLKSWPEQGPTLVWKSEIIGDGYSAATVFDDIIYVTGKIDSFDYITALNQDGKKLWQVPFGKAWDKSHQASRCTPTVEEERIYVISGAGDMVCLNRQNGQTLWSDNYMKRFEGLQLSWGIAESPLIVDNHVIATPGGNVTTMIAFDKKTGLIVWQTEPLNEKTAYVSPLLIRDKDYDMIVGVISTHIFGINPKDGSFLWKDRYADINTPTEHPDSPLINCNTPLYQNGKIFITSGYDHVGVQYQLAQDGNSVKPVWINSTLDCHIGGVVLVDGYIYGANWLSNSKGKWCCIEWETGKTMYETEWNCKGSIIYADGMLYCYEERNGNVALVKPDPNEFNIVSSFKIKDGKGPHWARPVIDEGILYIRHGDVLLAYNIKDRN